MENIIYRPVEVNQRGRDSTERGARLSSRQSPRQSWIVFQTRGVSLTTTRGYHPNVSPRVLRSRKPGYTYVYASEASKNAVTAVIDLPMV